MKSQGILRRTTIFVVFCSIALVTRSVRAAADAVAADKPTEWGSASVASLNKLSAVAGSIGVDLPSFMTAKGIGEQFPFVGADGIDPDKPIGGVMFAHKGWDISRGQGAVFILPVKADAAPLSGFTKTGGTPVQGHADSVLMNQVVFRRTADALILSPTPEAAFAADPAALAAGLAAHAADKAHAQPAEDMLAYLVLDFRAMRTDQPEVFKAFIAAVRQNTAPAGDKAQQAGQDFVFNFIFSLNRVDLSFAQRANDLELSLCVSPMNVPPAGDLPKPGMPAGAVGRYDLAAPPAKIIPPTGETVTEYVRTMASAAGQQAAEADRRRLESWFTEAIKLALGGQGLSVGLEPQPNGFVVYMVQQQPPEDLEARVKASADEFNAIGEKLDKPGNRSTIAIDHYTLPAGTAVTRLTMLDKAKSQGYIDLIVRDHQAFIAFAEDPAHHIEGLVNAPAAGRMSGLFVGEADLPKLIAAMKASPDSPLALLPADRVAALEQAVKGRTFTLRADASGDGLVIRMGLPIDLIKQLVQLSK
jgi:hypothetical protein